MNQGWRVALCLGCAAFLFGDANIHDKPVSGLNRIQIVQDMNFGDLLLDGRGGSVALTEKNELVCYTTAVKPSLRSRTWEARFTLRGEPKARYALRLEPEQPFLLAKGGGKLRIASFVYQSGALKGHFNDQGEAELRLGAKLDIPVSAPPGLYVHSAIRLSLMTKDLSTVSASELFAVKVSIKPILQIRNTSCLDFGNLIPGTITGAYRVDANGVGSDPGGAGIRQFRGRPQAAVFEVSGTPGTEYRIELPRMILLQGPGKALKVQAFEAGSPLTGIMPASGFIFRVGASLAVPPDQAPGRYSGEFLVTINYL